MADFEQYFEQYSQTETSGALLKRRSLQSGLITVAAQPFKLVIGIVATAVLARLVTPADFGLVAMVMPLLSFGDSLSNLGLESATVQQQSLNHQQASETFWFSLKVNAAIMAGMILLGPVTAKFYHQPSLTLLTWAMSVGFFSLCLSFQHKALLKRQMKFELLTAIELGAIAIATVAAVGAAWLGLGYWALMLQVVVMQVVQGIAYWLTCRWRPTRIQGNDSAKADHSTKAMLSYGANLTGFRFLTRIGMQLDRILVGYISGATALGFYDVAYRWAAFPFTQVYFSLFDVAVASFSRAYGDKEAYRQYCRWGIMPLFAICLPSLAFLYVAAEEVILVLLGDQWLAAVPIFRLLAIAMFVGSAHKVTKWLYMSSGQTQRQLHWGLIHTPLLIVAVCIGATQGAYGIAMGYTLGTCALTYPSVAYCLQKSPLTTADFWGTMWRPAVASIASALCLFWSQPGVSNIDNSFFRLSAEAIGFSSLYVLFWFLLPGGKRSVIEIVGHIKCLRSNADG